MTTLFGEAAKGKISQGCDTHQDQLAQAEMGVFLEKVTSSDSCYPSHTSSSSTPRTSPLPSGCHFCSFRAGNLMGKWP